MIEAELKFEIQPEAQFQLREKLRSMKFSGTVHNSDAYYDTVDFDLLRQAVFVRRRNNNKLQFKFNESRDKEHGQSIERAFPLSSDYRLTEQANALFARFLPQWQAASSFEEAVRKNQLIELARIKNTREEYTNDEIYLSVDHVEGLGDFLEVETRHEEGTDTTTALVTLQAFVSDLSLRRIRTGYVELWLRVHNPQAYRLGKYQL